jgi:hypothetical protein
MSARPLSGSQIRAVPSSPAVTSRRPSPLKASVVTALVWPKSSTALVPILTSQSLARPS